MDSEVRPKSTIGVKFRDPLNDGAENEISDGGREGSRQSCTETSFPSTSSSLKASKYEKYEREKIGHRRVTESGQVTYKKKPTTELMACIMLGIGQSIGGLTSKPERDLLMQDFAVVESVFFPSEGSNLTPAHSYSDFRFKTYAPMAFRYFRELFGIQPDDFLYSMCSEPLVELSNPGASGSVFYITSDDEFIIKTLQHKEAEFLQKLLPGYYMNLNQNPRTLLPKFYGLFCYQCGGKNIRFCVMNNLLPSSIIKHEKYDLKGSTYKRKASKREVAKKSPTLKDLDFVEIHPDGISMEPETYNALMKTLMRDGRVLESFKIMDYSLLLAVHNLDLVEKESNIPKSISVDDGVESEPSGPPRSDSNPGDAEKGLSRGRSVKVRLATYSTPLESIHADAQTGKNAHDSEDIPTGGIPAKNNKGERLLLFVGMIDILQNYHLRKKMEHTFKSIVHDGDTISVHRPGFYASRFLNFFQTAVFRKIPTPLKHSPSKKKSGWGRQRTISHPHEESAPNRHGSRYQKSQPAEEQGAIGGRPDVLPAMSTPTSHETTPPPTFHEATQQQDQRTSREPTSDQSQAVRWTSRDQDHGSHEESVDVASVSVSVSRSHEASSTNHEKTTATTTTTTTSHVDENRTEEKAGGGSVNLSPAPSNCGSTPTHTEFTEGTPSFTTSSASVCSDTLEISPVTSARGRTPVTTATHQSSSVTMVTHPQSSQSSSNPSSSSSSNRYHGYNDFEQHIVSPD